MGDYMSKGHWDPSGFTMPHKRLDNFPHPHKESPYDPLYGFPNGREIRESKVTWEQMDLAKLDYRERDYCAHLYMDLRLCFKKNFPFHYRCRNEKHAFMECEFEDQLIRIKEWERERRLNEREKRKKLKEMRDAQEVA